MKKHNPAQRFFAAALAVVMVFGAIPVTATASTLAQEGNERIIAFKQLAEETAYQTVLPGTSLSQLDLPKTLTATVQSISTGENQDNGEEFPGDNQLEEEMEPEDISHEDNTGVATSSSAQSTETGSKTSDSDYKSGTDKPTSSVEGSRVSIPVTWSADIEFDGTVEGEYLFTPELPGNYIMDTGVELPVITVTVGEAGQAMLLGISSGFDTVELDESMTADQINSTIADRLEEYATVVVTGSANVTEEINLFISEQTVIWRARLETTSSISIEGNGTFLIDSGADIYKTNEGAALSAYHSGNLYMMGGSVRVSSDSPAIYTSTDMVMTGGILITPYSIAIENLGDGDVAFTGGCVLIYSSSIDTVVFGPQELTSINAPAVVIAWNKNDKITYSAGENTDLITLYNASVSWEVEDGTSGIRYAYGSNMGFIPIEDITVEAGKPAVNNSLRIADPITYNVTGVNLATHLFSADPNAGARTYTIEAGSTGYGTISGDNLTITRAGVFNIGFVTAESSTHQAGAKIIGTLLVNKGERNAPTGLGSVDLTSAGGNDGKITGLIPGVKYEFKKDGDIYNPVTANGSGEITGLIEGSYVVRYAETDVYLASEDTSVLTIAKASNSVVLTKGMTAQQIQNAITNAYSLDSTVVVTGSARLDSDMIELKIPKNKVLIWRASIETRYWIRLSGQGVFQIEDGADIHAYGASGAISVSEDNVMFTAPTINMTGGIVRSDSTSLSAILTYVPTTISGGIIHSASPSAITTYSTNLTMTGGVALSHTSNTSSVVTGGNSSIKNSTLLIAWDKNNHTNYNSGDTTDLYSFEGATVSWEVEDGISGIQYEYGSNTGFIPIEVITVEAGKTPVNNGVRMTEPTTYAGEGGFYLNTLLFTVDKNAGARTYTIEEGSTGAGTVIGDVLKVTKAGVFHIGLVTAESSTHQAGAKVIGTFTVNKGERFETVEPGTVGTTTNGGSDGKITGLAPGEKYEYKKDGGSYIPVTTNGSGEITGLAAGSYVIRYAETDLYLSSQDSEVITITGPAQSNGNAVTGITAPKGAVVHGTNITASVANDVTSQSINLELSKGASWRLYSDSNCQNEIISKVVPLNPGINTAYVKVTAEDGTTQVYTLTITRANSGSSSSGGSGGSGSSNGSTGTTASSKPAVSVTGVSENKAVVDEQGNVIASVTDKNITDAIANAKAEAVKKGLSAGDITVSINVSTAGKNANTVMVNLPKTIQQQVISNQITKVELTIEQPDIVMGLNHAAIAEINRQANADVQLTATKTESSALGNEAKNAIGSRPAFDFKANYQEGSSRVTNFGNGSVFVSIPYTPSEHEKVGGLYAVYVDGEGKVSRVPGSAYDVNTKSLIFTTNHFSVYGISYQEPASQQTDISAHWTKDSMEYVIGRGLLTTSSGTNISPDAPISRGMLAAALGRLGNVDTQAYSANSFSDVNADSQEHPYIEWAYSKGVVPAANQQFAPDKPVTREEIAVIFTNYAKAMGVTLPILREAASYADASAIGTSSRDAVRAAQQSGIMMGVKNNEFSPKANVTYAQVSSILHRYIKLTIDQGTVQGWAKNDAGQYLYYTDGKAAAGKWLQIKDIWYYFYTDGTLAQNTKVDGYEVDENGALKN